MEEGGSGRCPSESNTCRLSKLLFTAMRMQMLDIVAILNQAHDKQVTDVYKYLVMNGTFKQGLIQDGFFSEVMYLDALADIWSVFSLPGLPKMERLARAYKGVVYLHAVIGGRLYTQAALKSGVLGNTDEFLGVTMNNLWESLTNCCAFLKLHCSEDGTSWIRLDLVSKIFSNDVIESYFSVLVNRCGGYKSFVQHFNQVAKNVDTMIQIQLSPARRHKTKVGCVMSSSAAIPSPEAAG